MSFDDEEECGERVDCCECDDGTTAGDILDGLIKVADLVKKIHELQSPANILDPDAPRKIEEYTKQLREEERHQELLKVEEGTWNCNSRPTGVFFTLTTLRIKC